jgi:hypothetical protein
MDIKQFVILPWFKKGQKIFVTSSYQKLEPKYGFQKKSLKVEFLGYNIL